MDSAVLYLTLVSDNLGVLGALDSRCTLAVIESIHFKL